MQTQATSSSKPPRPLLRWLPAILVMAAIFALSSRTGGQLDTWLPWFQDLFPGLTSFNPVHYFAYFGLSVAFAIGFGFSRLNVSRGLAVILLCVAYGATDEWHQSFVPLRSPDVNDLLHDGIGAAAAVILLWLWRFARMRRGSRNYSRS
ncbi:VanZ family protein [Cohnella zeiphila]|uniref:VanZ family protein n=1 Tax=Cohnella zeiphila TaxID=2761120 RepID=A0A7X0VTU1_9BACL|nr:VanZ family protein [Cohnella zeiphila]MBB6730254.1 VanZ family protein [Cohnella zeiphila]